MVLMMVFQSIAGVVRCRHGRRGFFGKAQGSIGKGRCQGCTGCSTPWRQELFAKRGRIAIVRSWIEQHVWRCTSKDCRNGSPGTVLRFCKLLQSGVIVGRMNLLPRNMIIVRISIFLTGIAMKVWRLWLLLLLLMVVMTLRVVLRKMMMMRWRRGRRRIILRSSMVMRRCLVQRRPSLFLRVGCGRATIHRRSSSYSIIVAIRLIIRGRMILFFFQRHHGQGQSTEHALGFST